MIFIAIKVDDDTFVAVLTVAIVTRTIDAANTKILIAEIIVAA